MENNKNKKKNNNNNHNSSNSLVFGRCPQTKTFLGTSRATKSANPFKSRIFVESVEKPVSRLHVLCFPSPLFWLFGGHAPIFCSNSRCKCSQSRSTLTFFWGGELIELSKILKLAILEFLKIFKITTTVVFASSHQRLVPRKNTATTFTSLKKSKNNESCV